MASSWHSGSGSFEHIGTKAEFSCSLIDAREVISDGFFTDLSSNPSGAEGLIGSESLLRVLFEKTADEIFCFVGDVVPLLPRHGEFRRCSLFVDCRCIFAKVKIWKCSRQHDVKKHPASEKINGSRRTEAYTLSTKHNLAQLWRHIPRGAHWSQLLFQIVGKQNVDHGFSGRYPLGYSEVRQLHFQWRFSPVKEYILRFQITVYNTSPVNVGESKKDLLDNTTNSLVRRKLPTKVSAMSQ